ncbi:MAG: flippase-like domain-containing protein [Clostridiaceae bacterium]|nr:flippase-like domain-containing protein [Clostridiaceae bacterium]
MKIVRILGYVVLLFLLVILFITFDFNSFVESIRKVSILGFIGLLFIQVVSQFLVNYQWCRIGKVMNKDYSFFKMLYINARGMIIESITPGVKIGGEVTRAYLLKKEMNYSYQESATLVTIQKMASFFSFFLLNLVSFAHLSGKVEIFQGAVRAVVFLFLFVFLGILVFMFVGTNVLENWVKNRKPKRKAGIALHKYMLVLLENIKVLKSIKGEMYKQFFLSSAIWIIYPLKMILLVNLFSVEYNWVFLTEVTFISYMVGMIPLMPGGLGGFETAMTSLLVLMQIEKNQALAITLLFRFITFWFVILLSLLYTGGWKIGERKKNNPKNQIRT